MILVSNSPRRQEILTKAGYRFEVHASHIDESYPDELAVEKIPEYLAEKKLNSIAGKFENEVLIAADTIVVLGGNIMDKPADAAQAYEVLKKLSGKTHDVISGVCVILNEKVISFNDITTVTFRELTNDEILFYIEHYEPYDKAGAYGIQEWIGLVGIEKIDGSYYNVMGLPIHKLYKALNMISGRG